jgi:hypothetical protein
MGVEAVINRNPSARRRSYKLGRSCVYSLCSLWCAERRWGKATVDEANLRHTELRRMNHAHYQVEFPKPAFLWRSFPAKK